MIRARRTGLGRLPLLARTRWFDPQLIGDVANRVVSLGPISIETCDALFYDLPTRRGVELAAGSFVSEFQDRDAAYYVPTPFP